MDPKLCGIGNGKYFLNTILNYLKNNNYKVVEIEVRNFNNRAINCYKSCGFVEIKKYHALEKFVVMKKIID